MKTFKDFRLRLLFQKRMVFRVVFVFVLMLSSQMNYAQYCDTPPPPEIMMMGGGPINPDCDSHLNYFPDQFSPLLYVKVNIHFILKNDPFTPKNFTETWDGIDPDNALNGVIWSQGLMDMINNVRLSNNEQMNLPPGNTTATLPYNFRLKLMGTYFHEDDNLWDACNGDYNTLLSTYGINTSSEINIFFTASGGVGSGCGAGGLGPGHVLIKGAWQAYSTMLSGPNSSTALADSYWSTARLVLHEVGHCLSH